jgi:hypothetical protein
MVVYLIVNEICTVFHFLALYFEKNCTGLSQSELRILFMYIIGDKKIMFIYINFSFDFLGLDDVYS